MAELISDAMAASFRLAEKSAPLYHLGDKNRDAEWELPWVCRVSDDVFRFCCT